MADGRAHSRLGRRAFAKGALLVGMLPRLVLAGEPGVRFAKPPKLYLYPSSYRFSDGRPLSSMETITLQQVTTDIPLSDRLAGVAVIIYWSEVEREPRQYDFSKIEAILEFWRRKGKTVILDIATIGYPRRGTAGEGVQPATPAWLLERSATYAYPSQILGFPERGQTANRFPDFRDGSFRQAAELLANALTRVDGHPALAQLRIPIGLMGEDNPLVGPPRHHLSWYTERLWLDYCRWAFDLYQSRFLKTQLEFDIGRLGWMSALGNEQDQRDVNRFVDSLRQRHVLLAFDGLSSRPEPDLANPQPTADGVTEGLRIMQSYARLGGQTGLEAAHPMAAPTMAEIGPIIQTVREIGPTRLLLFQDFIAGYAPNSPQWKAYMSAYGPEISTRVMTNSRALLRVIQ